MKKLKLAFVLLASATLCLSGVPAASAAGANTSDRESQLDAVLESNFWSKTTPATKAQQANRKALSIEVKEALANVSKTIPLSDAESSTLVKAGLGDLDPKNTTWKYADAVAVPVPASKSAAADP